MTSKTNGTIFERIPLIMADVDPIAKDRKGTGPGFSYAYRGIDDAYQALQAVLAKHGVFTVPKVLSERSEERQAKSGNAVIYRILTIRYRFYASDGTFFDAVVIGEGQDSGDKASNKAMSVAHKYALLQVFCIPTSEPKDPETDSHELEPKAAPAQRQEPKSRSIERLKSNAGKPLPFTQEQLEGQLAHAESFADNFDDTIQSHKGLLWMLFQLEDFTEDASGMANVRRLVAKTPLKNMDTAVKKAIQQVEAAIETGP